MYLNNGDKTVLYFDMEDEIMEVIDNDHLPYPLKDYVRSSDFSSPEAAKESARHFTALRDFLSGRTLNLLRENAKAILTSCGFSQSGRTNERIAITLACNGLSMTDNFWTRNDSDNRRFEEVDLRNHHLKDAAYLISISGISESVQHEILAPDISTLGMFAKTWYRGENKSVLLKTDKMPDNANTRAELAVSEMLDRTYIPHVGYEKVIRDGLIISACDNITDASRSIISARDLKDWCEHQGVDFLDYVLSRFGEDLDAMSALDYVIANTDRHLENFYFYVDNETNLITQMAPLFDHNQALIADIFKTDVSDIKYALTDKTMLESAREAHERHKLFLPERFFDAPEIISENLHSDSGRLDRAFERAKALGVEILKDDLYEIKHMEYARRKYMENDTRGKISWDGKKMGIAEFEDRYLSACKDVGVSPNERISEHFWKNCVAANGYEPQFVRQQINI